jgi:hypothetical protein
MRLYNSIIFLAIILVLGFALTLPALALNIGGHDETSEVNQPRWATGAPTVGVAPALTGIHLLISEVAVQGSPVEFIEIYNPTTEPVDLTNYYLTDAWYVPGTGPISAYYQLPAGTLLITTNTDFCSRFPSGAMIMPGGTIVVALYGAGIDSAYGVGKSNYEVTPSSPGIPDLISVGGNQMTCGTTTLTNGSEFVMLFCWDGLQDNVCDVDYVTWGSSSGTSRVDKTGLAIDGPDPDLVPTPYKNDTPIANQSAVAAPAAGSSVARVLLPEGVEAANGNGCCWIPATAVEYSTWGQIKTLYR